ncbi:hypothetical protein [methanotrophic endosymbiont of Bathymodiolus puteoserpentis (Logatchev)]|jgi:uncharacterized membrane protein YbaN (DUF454 family)|uniref:hypothetical protein n=1 Tax=methanotrophic endosymbiont of Bathymodiolus puteoserpentis (Logatchev) TaxID=343235 RepID=UPI0013CB5D2A|nr:hypothetical protein [methanotrophic endosymbiont of Bathymodiolus puteoserpentis (Logatchev)]SHE22600.1 hypothetical protein BPUTEOMOX_2312 [methanotrophic endosymbiont of Bathymodiolus puteoserpentis (Logatchev)]
MLKKSLLLMLGGFIFVIGMILFPLPVPFGLPTMIVGLAIMFKASNKVKRRLIRLFDKNKHSRKAWQKAKAYRRSKKESLIR